MFCPGYGSSVFLKKKNKLLVTLWLKFKGDGYHDIDKPSLVTPMGRKRHQEFATGLTSLISLLILATLC